MAPHNQVGCHTHWQLVALCSGDRYAASQTMQLWQHIEEIGSDIPQAAVLVSVPAPWVSVPALWVSVLAP